MGRNALAQGRMNFSVRVGALASARSPKEEAVLFHEARIAPALSIFPETDDFMRPRADHGFEPGLPGEDLAAPGCVEEISTQRVQFIGAVRLKITAVFYGRRIRKGLHSQKGVRLDASFARALDGKVVRQRKCDALFVDCAMARPA